MSGLPCGTTVVADNDTVSLEHGLACWVLRGMRQHLARSNQLQLPSQNHQVRLLRCLFLVAERLTDTLAEVRKEPLNWQPTLGGSAKFKSPKHWKPLRLPTLEAALRNNVKQLGWMTIDPECSTGLILTPAGERAAEYTLADIARRLRWPPSDLTAWLDAELKKWLRWDVSRLAQLVLREASRRVRLHGIQARLHFEGEELQAYLHALPPLAVPGDSAQSDPA